MNYVTLPVEQVRALVLASAKKDVRYYLNGTLIDFENCRAVSTDGHVLLAINIPAFCNDVAYGRAIIDRDALETISKGGARGNTVEIGYGADGVTLTRSDGLNITVAPIDAKFPQYERVIPAKVDGKPAQFDPDLLARMCKALRLACDAGAKALPAVAHNGGSGTLVAIHGYGNTAIGVIMPCRIDGDPVAELLTFNSAAKPVATVA